MPLYVRWEDHLPSVENVRFVQVGANCGANTHECASGGDPIWRYSAACGWRGVAVEPVAATFAKLCANYATLTPHVTPLRALVSNRSDARDGLVTRQGETSHAVSDAERGAARSPPSA